MSALNILVVDDDPLARANVVRLLRQEPDICLLAEMADGASTLESLAAVLPDLMFVDVELPDMSGFGLLGQLPAARRPGVIFTTGHREFGAEAFEVRAIDYLLKPYGDERFHLALDRARRQLLQPGLESLAAQMDRLQQRIEVLPVGNSTPPFALPGPEQQFMAKSGNDIHIFKPEQIKWVEGQGDYLRIHGVQGNSLVRETMKNFLARATSGSFVRVHKSAIVNLRHVRRLIPLDSGDYRLELHDGTPIRVSRNYFPQLKLALRR